MRIDYSEPKKSCSSSLPSGHNRPRRESSGGGVLAVALISGLLCLGIGFGSGWMLSQRSAKKAFKAAMEQQSLENSPQQTIVQPSVQQPAVPAPHAPAVAQQPQTGGPAPTDKTPAPIDPPLSFYKTLPSGQKNTALGSGINPKSDKPGKQPLQAAMPGNITRPAPPENEDSAQKQPAQPAPAKPVSHQEPGGLTVQVASYNLKSEAETQRSKLAAKGYNATIVESFLGSKGTWYRVRVGKRLDAAAAKELADKIGKGAIVIPDKD